jgi:hypothetical protein
MRCKNYSREQGKGFQKIRCRLIDTVGEAA